MLRMILLILSFLFVISCQASSCLNSVPTNNAKFCGSFKTAARCYCRDAGLPSGMCQDMKQIFNRMTSVYGSLQSACRHQKHTTVQLCVDGWNCYLIGGKDSKNQLCSGHGRACE